jgi:hypothetical protein
VSTDERWERQTAGSYADARNAIRDRLRDDEIVLAWYVDRG